MRQIALLRGVNVGPRNRVAMADLRAALAERFDNVATHLQSGNVVLNAQERGEDLAQECERLIAERFGLEIAVLVRTAEELRIVIERDPLAGIATDPKRYQVSFLAAEPDPAVLERLSTLAAGDERLVAEGRELYAWHPDGIARSRLWAALAGPGLGVRATARNWTTVNRLLAMARS